MDMDMDMDSVNHGGAHDDHTGLSYVCASGARESGARASGAHQ